MQKAPWEPKASKDQTRESVIKYRMQPSLWDGNEEQIEDLQKHAEYHRIPFARSKKHQENYITGALKQFGTGWGEGFSANILQGDDEPDNTVEGIARQLGNLAGFIGYIPGARFIKPLQAIAKFTRNRSIPMRVATRAQKGMSKLYPSVAREMPSIGKIFSDENKLGDVLSGAFHLGIASGVSDWRGIVDEGMPRALESVGMGAVWGGGFRALGNTKAFGKRLENSQVDPSSGLPILKKLEPGQLADLGIRAAISSVIAGKLAEYQGAPTEQQVYEYVMGAAFSFNDTPLQLRLSRKAIHETVKNKYGYDEGFGRVPDPEAHPDWDKWTPEAQKQIQRDFDAWFGTDPEVKAATLMLQTKAMKNGKLTHKDIEETMDEMVRKNLDTAELNPEGELIDQVTKADLKKVREVIKNNPNNEDYQDLDMHINKLSNLPGKIAGGRGYVDKYILPRTGKTSTADRLVESLKISKKWDELHTITQGVARPKEGAVDEIIKFIKKEYKTETVDQKEIDWWRNWAEQTRKKRLVLQTYVIDGETAYIDKGVSPTGEKKELAFEPPRIQQTFENLNARMGNKPENFYTISSFFVRNGKEYEFSKVDEKRLQRDLKAAAPPGTKPADAKAIIRQYKSKLVKDLNDIGYYYVGGRGDKAAMYFVKKNPMVDPANRYSDLSMIRKAYANVYKKSNGKLGMSKEQFDLHIDNMSRDYKNRYRGMDGKQYYMDSLINNVYYDLHNNFRSSVKKEDIPAMLEKMIGSKGFIRDAKAYNKRAQVWFNSGQTTNEKVANEYLHRFFRRYRKEDNLPKGFKPLEFVGKRNAKAINMAIWDDSIGIDKKNFKADRKNMERPEGFDGGIPALPEFIYALNKANGITNEGRVNKSFIVSPSSRHGAMLGKYMFFEASPKLQKAMRQKKIHALAPESGIKQMGYRQFANIIMPKKSKKKITQDAFQDMVKDLLGDKGFFIDAGRVTVGGKKFPAERIGDIYIKPEHQRKGLGSKFANLVEQYKRSLGLDEIHIEAVGGRKSWGSEHLDNIDFWKKQGYVVAGKGRKVKIPKDAKVLNPEIKGHTVWKIPMKKDIKGISINGPTYEVPLKHIRTVLSETTSKDDLLGAKFAKQMWTTIMHFGKNPTNPELIKSMSDELIKNSVEGDESLNRAWDKHIESPNEVSERKVLEDIDRVSLDRLMRALTDTQNEAFSSKVYDRIIKRNIETTREGTKEAEHLKDEYYKTLGEVSEFESIIDRVGELYPKGNLGFYMHKFAKNYRQNAVKNYIVDRISRPKMKNGMKARMRPWDHGMWESISDINEKQNVFYLDDGAKSKKIYDPFFARGYETLGKIWKEYQKGENGIYKDNLDTVKDILEGVAMRVPMDSMSGAHVLEFGGFTGTGGHGVLLHGRVMDALGGADLDGDKAWIFFGGKSGMHKDWKEIYKQQVDEFVKDDGTQQKAKSDYARERFVKKDVRLANHNDNALSKYDPHLRAVMSEAAADGRESLRSAVITRQVLASAYDAIRLTKGTVFSNNVKYIKGKYYPSLIQDGSYYYPIEHKGKVVYMKQTPKKKGGAVERFKELSRAAINLGADPMDEMGIVESKIIKQHLTDSLFNFEFVRHKEIGKKKKKKFVFSPAYDLNKNTDYSRELRARTSTLGLHLNYSTANNALYGRNYASGNKYGLGEIQAGVNDINWIPKYAQRNLLNFIATEYKQIPYEDNIFRRLDREQLDNLYNYNRREMGDSPDLLKLFDRTSMMTRMGPMIDNVIKHKIYNLDERMKLARNKEKFWDLFSRHWYPQFDAQAKGKKGYEMGRIPPHLYSTFMNNKMNTSLQDRLQYLEYKLNQAEDFLVNDLSDMASLKHIMQVKEEMNIGDDEFKMVNQMVQDLKNSSFWIKKHNRELVEQITKIGEEQNAENDAEQFLKYMGLRKKINEGLSQTEIDNQILFDKKKLKRKPLQDLYDAMLLGTFQKTNLDKVRALEKKKLNNAQRMFLEKLQKAGQNTSLLRLGFSSKNVKDANVKAHLDEYNKLYKGIVQPTAKETEAVKEVGKDDESKKPSYINDLNKVVEGKILEASDLSDSDRFYMDNIEPWLGAKRGKIKDPELLEVIHKLKNHLTHYHNLDARDFNGLFRSLFQKNINMANKQDYINFERFFQDMRDGSTWVRMMNWLKGGPDKRPEIERRYWNRFPEANQREWLKYPGMVKWKEDVTPFKDRFNNSIMGRTIRPTTVIGDLQNFAWKGAEYSLQTSEDEVNRLRDELAPFTQANEDGTQLHKIAVSIRERGMVHLLKEIMGDDPLLMQKQRGYMDNYNEMMPVFNKLKKKIYAVPTKDGVKNMTGEEIVTKINEIYTQKNKDIAKIINGDQQWFDDFVKPAYNKNGDLTWAGLDRFYKKYLNYTKERFRKGEKLDINKIGINGAQEINRLITLKFSVPRKQRTRRLLKSEAGKLGIGVKFTETWDPEHYYPHVSFDRKNVDAQLQASLEAIFNNKKTTKKQKNEAAKKLIYQSKTMTGDWAPKSVSEENWDAMVEVFHSTAESKRKRKTDVLPRGYKKAYSQFQREAHLSGWSRGAEAYEANIKNLVDSFYKESMLTLSRSHIQEFYSKFLRQSKDKDLSRRWADFLKLYTQSSMGYPVDIPEAVQNDPNMKISLTPYKWFADSNTRKRIDSIREKLGITNKALEKYGVSKEDAKELNAYSQSQLQYWSGLEAKWQMASLLAHPKSAITNLFGGQVHTGISAGIENLKNARDIEYLRTNINPEWRSMRDVEKWVEGLGIVEEFLLHEAGMNKELRGKRMKDFIKDVSSKLKGDPDYKDSQIRALAKKYKITDSMWNKASWFMRRPERTLRRDAFIAHYLQAKKNFGGAIKDYNHPFLIEMGRRGVKATQFLYSAPFRPMWTNSALGRVMSRFQLWSWNSVRFRKDLLQEARLRGFTPGTQEYNRAKRLVTADLMVYGLSSMFMYSLFDNALPAPWNWFQDTANMLLGDDKDRERAFYGNWTGPLSIIKPPLFRFDQPVYEGLINGDWSKMTDYYLYTLLPFGRIIKDVVGPGGMMENPFYTVEKMTGIPYIQGGNWIKEATEGDSEAKGIFSDLYT